MIMFECKQWRVIDIMLLVVSESICDNVIGSSSVNDTMSLGARIIISIFLGQCTVYRWVLSVVIVIAPLRVVELLLWVLAIIITDILVMGKKCKGEVWHDRKVACVVKLGNTLCVC